MVRITFGYWLYSSKSQHRRSNLHLPLLKSYHQDLGQELAYSTFCNYVQSNDDTFLFRGDPIHRFAGSSVVCKFQAFKGVSQVTPKYTCHPISQDVILSEFGTKTTRGRLALSVASSSGKDSYQNNSFVRALYKTDNFLVFWQFWPNRYVQRTVYFLV